jgi:hypothetical protein
LIACGLGPSHFAFMDDLSCAVFAIQEGTMLTTSRYMGLQFIEFFFLGA